MTTISKKAHCSWAFSRMSEQMLSKVGSWGRFLGDPFCSILSHVQSVMQIWPCCLFVYLLYIWLNLILTWHSFLDKLTGYQTASIRCWSSICRATSYLNLCAIIIPTLSESSFGAPIWRDIKVGTKQTERSAWNFVELTKCFKFEPNIMSGSIVVLMMRITTTW